MWIHTIDRVMVLYKYLSVKGVMLPIGLNVLIMCLFWKFVHLQFFGEYTLNPWDIFFQITFVRIKAEFSYSAVEGSNNQCFDEVKGRCKIDICLRTMLLSRMEGSEVKLHTF